jgi:hypothetical protein
MAIGSTAKGKGGMGFLSCCLVPEHIVDHWDEFADLPDEMRYGAVERGRKHIQAELDRLEANARAFRENRARQFEKHPELFKVPPPEKGNFHAVER